MNRAAFRAPHSNTSSTQPVKCAEAPLRRSIYWSLTVSTRDEREFLAALDRIGDELACIADYLRQLALTPEQRAADQRQREREHAEARRKLALELRESERRNADDFLA